MNELKTNIEISDHGNTLAKSHVRTLPEATSIPCTVWHLFP